MLLYLCLSKVQLNVYTSATRNQSNAMMISIPCCWSIMMSVTRIVHHQIKSQPPPSSSFQKGQISNCLPTRPLRRSTAILDRGATRLAGDNSVSRSNIVTSNSTIVSDSPLDQIIYALRRMIVDGLIKTPKTFHGGKEDVKQWLEDIEQLFDTAQIPENHKLDLVQYSLRGEVARWFKHNKTIFRVCN